REFRPQFVPNSKNRDPPGGASARGGLSAYYHILLPFSTAFLARSSSLCRSHHSLSYPGTHRPHLAHTNTLGPPSRDQRGFMSTRHSQTGMLIMAITFTRMIVPIIRCSNPKDKKKLPG